jgi:hypothetical protein
VSLEIEVTYNSAKAEVLLIGWFEGGGRARMICRVPAGAREEIQINRIGASLTEEAKPIFLEQAPTLTGQPMSARINVSLDARRVGRLVSLSRKGSAASQLCAKLVDMASLLARDEVVLGAVNELKAHLQTRPSKVPKPRRSKSHPALGAQKDIPTTTSYRKRR